MRQSLRQFLNNFSLVEGTNDRWTWGDGTQKAFSVKEAYKELTYREGRMISMRPTKVYDGLIWKAWATMKAHLLAWRLLRNRLQTKENVDKSIDLNDEERRCGGCDNERETAVHAFMECGEVNRIWSALIDWIGVTCAMPSTIEGHFLSFAGMFKKKKWKRSLWLMDVYN